MPRNRLRGFAWLCGALVVVPTAWVVVRYETASVQTVSLALLAGVALPAVPWLVPRLRHAGRRGVARLRPAAKTDPRTGGESLFQSTTPVAEREETLAAIVGPLQRDELFDEARIEEFPEGPGLTAVYTGFHNSFVRFTSGNHIVVSGDSRRTRRLREVVERSCGVDFERVRRNPHATVDPVRGGSRVVLGALLAVAVVVAGSVAVNAAYPQPTYNDAEKATFVAIDARAAVDPGFTQTDASLAKASLMVSSVREETAELAWRRDDSAGVVVHHADQALAAAADVRRLLETVRSGSPTPAQRERADRIASRLVDAERRLAGTIAARNQNQSDPRPSAVSARRRLLADANRTAASLDDLSVRPGAPARSQTAPRVGPVPAGTPPD